MNLHERIRRLVAALPSDHAAVTLTRADLATLLDAPGAPDAPARPRDLTVKEVAEETGRDASTVRGWLIAGQLRGYKLNGRDWRVPVAALRDYLDGQVRRAKPEPASEPGEDVDISAWRRIRRGGAA
jgi:excisionase family DNA binding protein